MKHLHGQVSIPWICVGNFNELLLSHTKRGGRPCRSQDLQAFNEVLTKYGLHDARFSGYKYT